MKKFIIFFLLGFFLFNIKFLAEDESYVRIDPVPKVEAETKVVKKTYTQAVVREPTLEEQKEIERIFGGEATIAIAVFKHESNLNYKAQNWNCWYYNEDGKKYSTSCKKEDRHLAWSVDCSLGQINVKGQTCPEELMTFEGSMKAIEPVYKAQGLGAWQSFNNKKYLKYMP